MRIIHEAHMHRSTGTAFITLTYRNMEVCTDDELEKQYFLPESGTLVRSHFQKFMKRLRKGFNERIRFFACGEYGSKCVSHRVHVDDCDVCNVGRPHYHACLFGITFLDLIPLDHRNGITYYTSRTLEEIWKYGDVQVGEVTFESAGYVARYCMKKVTGDRAYDHYQVVDRDGVIQQLLPEQCWMSRRPGIGAEFFDLYKGDFFPSDECPVPIRGSERVEKKVPRYYFDRFDDESVKEEMKALRKAFRDAHGEEYSPVRLLAKERVKLAQVKQLRRTL